MSMKVPACYRNFGAGNRANGNYYSEKVTLEDAVSYRENGKLQKEKKCRKYKAPCLSVKE